MGNRKKYTEPVYYEGKLERVMTRLGVDDAYTYNFDRHGAWVEFKYRGQLYRFDHTVQKARASGQDLSYGSDAFAQIVLALEDLSRMVERGIYDLSTWVAGMKFLPDTAQLPGWVKLLGFELMPSNAEDVKARYRNLAKQYHPDAGGDPGDFEKIKTAAEQGIRHFGATSEERKR